MNPHLRAALPFILLALAAPVFGGDNGFLLTRSTVEIDYSGVLRPLHETTNNVYDSHGNLTRSVAEWDGDDDGIVDGINSSTRSYDARQRLVLRIDEEDYLPRPAQFRRETTTITYPSVNQRREFLENDLGGDSEIEQTTTTTSTLDHRGTPLLQILEYDGLPVDGIIDGTNVITRTYDHRGFPLSETRGLEVSNWTYDDRNHQVTFVSTNPVAGIKLVYSVDSHRNVLSATGEGNNPFSGEAYHYSEVNTYDRHGNVIHTMIRWDPDGFVWTYNITHTYVHRGEILADIHASERQE